MQLLDGSVGVDWKLVTRMKNGFCRLRRGGGQLDISQAVLRFFFKEKRPKWLVNYWWKCAHVLHEVET